MQEQQPRRHRSHGRPSGRRFQNYDNEEGSNNNWVRGNRDQGNVIKAVITVPDFTEEDEV